MHGIGTQQTTFDQGGSKHRFHRADLVFFRLHLPLRQHRSSGYLREREQVHHWLMRCLVPIRPSQGFAIQVHVLALLSL